MNSETPSHGIRNEEVSRQKARTGTCCEEENRSAPRSNESDRENEDREEDHEADREKESSGPHRIQESRAESCGA